MKKCKHLKYSNDFGRLLEKLQLLSTEINPNMNTCRRKLSNPGAPSTTSAYDCVVNNVSISLQLLIKLVALMAV